MKLLTYNIRNESACDGVNAFHNRRGYVIDQLETEKPDIIGFQEITQPMYPYSRASARLYADWLRARRRLPRRMQSHRLPVWQI